MIKNGAVKKGDVLSVAQVAGIMAAKQTSSIIPMCHSIMLEHCDLAFEFCTDTQLRAEATVCAQNKTGVEMEALTAVSTALLTIYDMAKAADRGMTITNIRLLEKSGGTSGTYIREEL